MIEIFRTNISDPDMANVLIILIQKNFNGYQANFDLDDNDNILRIKSEHELINIDLMISFLSKLGCNAEVLPD